VRVAAPSFLPVQFLGKRPLPEFAANGGSTLEIGRPTCLWPFSMREDLCRPLRPLLQRSDVFPSLSKLIDTTRIHLNIGLQNFELVAAAAAGAPPAAANELCSHGAVNRASLRLRIPFRRAVFARSSPTHCDKGLEARRGFLLPTTERSLVLLT
jgi:hypothetical protein